jgi:hypothetical protein
MSDSTKSSDLSIQWDPVGTVFSSQDLVTIIFSFVRYDDVALQDGYNLMCHLGMSNVAKLALGSNLYWKGRLETHFRRRVSNMELDWKMACRNNFLMGDGIKYDNINMVRLSIEVHQELPDNIIHHFDTAFGVGRVSIVALFIESGLVKLDDALECSTLKSSTLTIDSCLALERLLQFPGAIVEDWILSSVIGSRNVSFVPLLMRHKTFNFAKSVRKVIEYMNPTSQDSLKYILYDDRATVATLDLFLRKIYAYRIQSEYGLILDLIINHPKYLPSL